MELLVSVHSVCSSGRRRRRDTDRKKPVPKNRGQKKCDRMSCVLYLDASTGNRLGSLFANGYEL